MDKYVVSACLLGNKCKYNGKDNYNQKVIDFLKDKSYIVVCPECLGDLDVPRAPSEIKGDKVINSEGKDVTVNFINGSNEALKLAKTTGCNKGILKSNSPSCSKKFIYNGNFEGVLKEGKGYFAQRLEKEGFELFDETEF